VAAVITHLKEGKKTELPAVALFGRKETCTFFLPDQRVSRQHAIIRQQNVHEFWFSDLGSFNGSSINGRRVVTTQRLHNSDILSICGFDFRFDQAPPDQLAAPTYEASLATIGEIRNEKALMLVSDLQGYTTLSERLPPDQLAQIVGGWYRSCEEVMLQHGAVIDKFIGDAVLSFWLTPSETSLTAALKSAADLMKACHELQQKHRELLAPTGLKLAAGLGLHAGNVVLSPVSAGVKTILGDSVNVTFRLEGLTRQLNESILLSAEAVALDPAGCAQFKSCGSHLVKGRSSPLEVFSWKPPESA